VLALYGITSCDTVRKARRWLETRGIAYEFVDLRAGGLDRAKLVTWSDALGWDQLVNRRSTTWRNLPLDRRESIGDSENLIQLLLEQPTLIKRPVLERSDGVLLVGFDAERYREQLG